MLDKRERFRLALIAVVAMLVLTSCLGVEVVTKFNADGSGTMKMKLRISQMLLQMGQSENDAPVPLTKEDLESAYKGLDGVTVDSVAQENTDQDRIITASVGFKHYDVFRGAEDLAGAGATLTKEDGATVYRVLIGEVRSATPDAEPSAEAGSAGRQSAEAPSSVVPPSGAAEAEGGSVSADGTTETESGSTTADAATEQAMQMMIKSLVAGYSIDYTVTAPTPVVSHSFGEVSADGKTVHYAISMSDYMDLKEPVTFEVKW